HAGTGATASAQRLEALRVLLPDRSGPGDHGKTLVSASPDTGYPRLPGHSPAQNGPPPPALSGAGDRQPGPPGPPDRGANTHEKTLLLPDARHTVGSRSPAGAAVDRLPECAPHSAPPGSAPLQESSGSHTASENGTHRRWRGSQSNKKTPSRG